MGKVFKVYFRHHSIWIYFAVCLAIASFLITKDSFFKYYYVIPVLLIAPFYEWVIHKYYLHSQPKYKSKFWNDYFEKVHPGHHRDPYNLPLVFAPVMIGLSVPFQFFLLFWLISQDIYMGLFAAFLAMGYYLYYEWIHLAHHMDEYTPITKRGRNLKKAHKWHHFKNENMWWGVTSSFGDKVLGTYPPPKDMKPSPSVKNIWDNPNLKEQPQA